MAPRIHQHPLHHTKEVEDMRQSFRRSPSYNSSRAPSSQASSQGSNSESEGSCRSYQTQPTEYSNSLQKTVRDCDTRAGRERYFEDRMPQESPKASTISLASTVQSEEDLQELLDYDVPEYTTSPYEATAIPSTPSDFSKLFPSRRRLVIQHDDSTLDGNMNLRIDTSVDLSDGRRASMTLFHLRMHDLRTRAFSLRRHCRDSGREVCHTLRKQQKAGGDKRPGFQRSLSNALNSMKPKTDSKNGRTSFDLKRNDSGYGSIRSMESDREDRPVSQPAPSESQPPQLSDMIKLEFTNYAQADVKRTGSKANKRYDFQYWGAHYCWRRVLRKESHTAEVAYHLTKTGSDTVLARIEPTSLSPIEAEEEQNKGGWIPPCSMWISDEGIVAAQKDVSDVVVATGLIALVDDSIHARFHSKESKQLFIPKMGVDYIGPKRLINEMFKRDSSSHQLRTASNSRPSSRNGTFGSRPPTATARPQSNRE